MKHMKLVLGDTVHQKFKVKCAVEGKSMKDKLDELIKEYIGFDKEE